MYVELPAVTATPAERLQALKDARELLTTTPGETKPAIFGGGSVETVYAPETAEMLRLAEYITTGHDYADTHPKGKRRPIIKHIANVTVVAPDVAEEDDINHLLHHLFNGDFDQPEEAETEKSAEEETEADMADKVQDEEAHHPVADGDRPRFGKASDFS